MNKNNEIFCTVQQCCYHEVGNKCSADKVEVGSCKDCCDSCDTECVTFKPKN